MSSSRNYILPILVGTPDTSNALWNPDGAPEDYSHIVTVTEPETEGIAAGKGIAAVAARAGFTRPNMKLVRGMQTLLGQEEAAEPAAPADGDLWDAIILAIYHMSQLGKAARLLIITDASAPVRYVEQGKRPALAEELAGCAEQLRNLHVTVNVVLVGGGPQYSAGVDLPLPDDNGDGAGGGGASHSAARGNSGDHGGSAGSAAGASSSSHGDSSTLGSSLPSSLGAALSRLGVDTTVSLADSTGFGAGAGAAAGGVGGGSAGPSQASTDSSAGRSKSKGGHGHGTSAGRRKGGKAAFDEDDDEDDDHSEHDDDADCGAGAAAAIAAPRSSQAERALQTFTPAELEQRRRRTLNILWVLDSLVTSTATSGEGSEITVATSAAEATAKVRVRKASSVAKFRGNLSIGGTLHVPVATYGMIVEGKLPTASKMPRRLYEALAAREAAVAAAQAAGGAEAAVEALDGYGDDGEGGEGDEAGAGAGASAGAGAGARGGAKKAKFVVSETKYFTKRAIAGGAAGAGGTGAGGAAGAGGDGRRAAVNAEGLDDDDDGGDGMDNTFGAGAAADAVAAAAAAGGAGADANLIEVAQADTQLAFDYGRARVPVADPAILAWQAEKGIDLLGFVAASSVPRELIIGGADILLPWHGNLPAAQAVSALARAMVAEELVGIVRYHKRRDFAPQLAILAPGLRRDLPRPTTATQAAVLERIAEAARSGESSSSAGVGTGAGAGAGEGLEAHMTPEELEKSRRADALLGSPAPLELPGLDCMYLLPFPWQDDLRDYAFASLGRECRHPPVDALAEARAASDGGSSGSASSASAARGGRKAAALGGAGTGAGAGAGAGAERDRLAPTTEQLEAADALIAAMTVGLPPGQHERHHHDDAYGDDALHHHDPYVPLMMPSPVISRFTDTLRNRALAPPGMASTQVPLAPVDPAQTSFLAADGAALLSHATKEAAKFRATFGPTLRRGVGAGGSAAASTRDLIGGRALYAELTPEQQADWMGALAADPDVATARAGEEAAAAGAASSSSGGFGGVGSKRGASQRASQAADHDGDDGHGDADAAAAAGAPSTKRSRHDGADASSGGSGAGASAGGERARIRAVTSAQPLEDFAFMMRYRGPDGDLTRDAVKGLLDVVRRLAGSRSAGEQDKAVACLAAFRAAAPSALMEGDFNAALRKLKAEHVNAGAAAGAGRGSPDVFWQRVQRAGITLFYDGETVSAAGLGVTREDADAFIGRGGSAAAAHAPAAAAKAEPAPAPAPKPVEAEEEEEEEME